MALFYYNVATAGMTKVEKKLQKFFQNPDSLKYFEIESLFCRFNFQKIEAKGSHKKFKHPQLTGISIPIRNHDCKPVYKKYVAKILKALRDSQQ